MKSWRESLGIVSSLQVVDCHTSDGLDVLERAIVRVLVIELRDPVIRQILLYLAGRARSIAHLGIVGAHPEARATRDSMNMAGDGTRRDDGVIPSNRYGIVAEKPPECSSRIDEHDEDGSKEDIRSREHLEGVVFGVLEKERKNTRDGRKDAAADEQRRRHARNRPLILDLGPYMNTLPGMCPFCAWRGVNPSWLRRGD